MGPNHRRHSTTASPVGAPDAPPTTRETKRICPASILSIAEVLQWPSATSATPARSRGRPRTSRTPSSPPSRDLPRRPARHPVPRPRNRRRSRRAPTDTFRIPSVGGHSCRAARTRWRREPLRRTHSGRTRNGHESPTPSRDRVPRCDRAQAPSSPHDYVPPLPRTSWPQALIPPRAVRGGFLCARRSRARSEAARPTRDRPVPVLSGLPSTRREGRRLCREATDPSDLASVAPAARANLDRVPGCAPT